MSAKSEYKLSLTRMLRSLLLIRIPLRIGIHNAVMQMASASISKDGKVWESGSPMRRKLLLYTLS